MNKTKFSGEILLTIVDIDKGYWQGKLHSDSRKLICMACDIGSFQWKRLPMGTVIVSNIFQKLDTIHRHQNTPSLPIYQTVHLLYILVCQLVIPCRQPLLSLAWQEIASLYLNILENI